METNMKEIQIPFSGFYESAHSAMLDDAVEQSFHNDQGNIIWPEPDAKDAKERELAAIGDFWDFTLDLDWRKIHEDYAKEYAANFLSWFNQLGYDSKEGGLVIDLKYKALSSPREYNFTTDRLFCEISLEDIRKLFDHVDKEILAKQIEENHSSRSGFHSFYSNDIATWLEKPLEEWDHNELATLLEAVIIQYEGEDYMDKLSWDLMEDDRGNGVLDNIIWGNMPKKEKWQPILDWCDAKRSPEPEPDSMRWPGDFDGAHHVAEKK